MNNCSIKLDLSTYKLSSQQLTKLPVITTQKLHFETSKRMGMFHCLYISSGRKKVSLQYLQICLSCMVRTRSSLTNSKQVIGLKINFFITFNLYKITVTLKLEECKYKSKNLWTTLAYILQYFQHSITLPKEPVNHEVIKLFQQLIINH